MICSQSEVENMYVQKEGGIAPHLTCLAISKSWKKVACKIQNELFENSLSSQLFEQCWSSENVVQTVSPPPHPNDYVSNTKASPLPYPTNVFHTDALERKWYISNNDLELDFNFWLHIYICSSLYMQYIQKFSIDFFEIPWKCWQYIMYYMIKV